MKAFLLCLILSLSSIADEIVIMADQFNPPKVSYNDKGEATGVLIDIMKYVDSKMAVEFRYELYPWKRAYNNALNGQGGLIGLSINEERKKIIDYSAIMYYDDIMIVVRKENVFDYKTVEDLRGKLLGAQRGSSYGEEFEQAKDKVFKVAKDNNPQERLLKLLHKRIDVALLGPGVASVENVIAKSEQLRKRKDELVILKTPFKRDPNYLGFSKTMRMKAFLAEFNKVLAEGYASGDIPEIIKKATK